MPESLSIQFIHQTVSSNLILTCAEQVRHRRGLILGVAPDLEPGSFGGFFIIARKDSRHQYKVKSGRCCCDVLKDKN